MENKSETITFLKQKSQTLKVSQLEMSGAFSTVFDISNNSHICQTIRVKHCVLVLLKMRSIIVYL